jgi:hypothetical protein
MKKKRSGRSRSRQNKKKIDGRQQQQKKSPLKTSPKKTSRCWVGYEPTPGKIPYSKGSCRKIQ